MRLLPIHKGYVMKYFILLFFPFASLFSLDFSNDHNHFLATKITQFKICGERCSGTNFLTSLVAKNFPSLYCSNHKYGHKHYLCWFEFPYDQQHLNILPSRNYFLTNSSQCLFIVIVRNVDDWLRSLYIQGWEIEHNLLNKGFSHFIRAEWKTTLVYDGNQYDSVNPYTNKPFENILELRACKHRNYLELAKRVKNFCLVKYEDVAEDPEGFIQFLTDYFALQRSTKFIPINGYKSWDNSRPFVKSEYFPISKEDSQFISDNLYLDWEHLVGY